MQDNRGQIPGHEFLERQLASAGVEISASEVQGVLCGLLCVGREDAPLTWYGELFEEIDSADLLVKECQQWMFRLFQRTKADMQDPAKGFTPLLPDDDQPLRQRARALVEWCQGFLYGLGLSGVSETEYSQDTREALRDFSEVTRMDLDSMEDSEQNEEAYTEISEFVWVAAMLVLEEIGSHGEGRS